MGLTQIAFLGILAAVGIQRIVELRLSKRHQRNLVAKGVVKTAEPQFVWMVVLHVGVLVGAAAEVLIFDRKFFPALAVVMLALVIASNAMRWWVMRVLGNHFTVPVMESTKIGVIVNGPYRWVRHPNYFAVYVEMLALPLLHTAWITASLGAITHLIVLNRRIKLEDSVLFSSSQYRDLMGAKPRFLPKFF